MKGMTIESLKDFIWMSVRYCIGRKTISTNMHVGTVAEIIYNYKEELGEDWLNWLSTDIRDGINELIIWDSRINVINSYVGKDIYSTLLYNIHTVENPNRTKFTIDGNTLQIVDCQEVQTIPSPIREYIDCDYSDLICWVKLANILDSSTHKQIACEWDDKNGQKISNTEICYSYPARSMKDGKWEYFQAWSSVKLDLHKGHIITQSYVVPEYIKEIKNLN